MNNYPDLLLHHFLAWQRRENTRKTLKEFADFLGLSKGHLNHFTTGRRLPSQEVAENLYRLTGDERFCTMAGYDVPDARLKLIQDTWRDISEEERNKIASMFAQYESKKRKPATKPR